MPEYKFYLLRTVNRNSKIYKKPVTVECAALVESEDGEIP